MPEVQIEIEEQLVVDKYLIRPLKTNVCEIEEFPERFLDRQVVAKATLYAYGNEIILYPIILGTNGCSYKTGNSLFGSLLELENYQGKNHKLKNKLMKNKLFPKEVDVEVEGTINIFYDEYGDKRINFIPNTIKIISLFREFTAKGAA